jgi:hypothetical protein
VLHLHKPNSRVAVSQLLLKSPELQSRLGRRYCDESELLPLLLSHGLVGRVRTIEVAVHPLGGDNSKTRLDATKPSAGEAKAEIACRLCAGDCSGPAGVVQGGGESRRGGSSRR